MRRNRSWRGTIATVLAMAMPWPGFGATTCTNADERAALDMRLLQTELMVAALSCGAAERYNDFAGRFQPVLVRHGQALKRFFDRAHGGAGPTRLNSFVTDLANQAATLSARQGEAFCGGSSKLFDEVLALDGGALPAYAGKRVSAIKHDYDSCAPRAAPAKR